MILPSINASNCGNLLPDSATIPSGNETAYRKNAEVGTIRRQATLKKAEASSAKKSNLSLKGKVKFSRMGRVFLLVRTAGFFAWVLYAQMVQAVMVEFSNNGKVSDNMMDNFVRTEKTSQMFFHNQSVLHNISHIIFVGMINSKNHTVFPFGSSSFNASMVSVSDMEPMFSCYSIDMEAMDSEMFSYLSGCHSLFGHFFDLIRIDTLKAGDTVNTVFLHTFSDNFIGNTIFAGNLSTRFKFFIFLPELFRGDKEFTMSSHRKRLTPYQQYCQEEISRYSHFCSESYRDRIKSLSIRQIGNQGDGGFLNRSHMAVMLYANRVN